MLTTYINGVSYKMTADFNISDMVGNKTTSDVELFVENQPIPRAGDIIEIHDIPTKWDIDLSSNMYSVRISASNRWSTAGKCWIKPIPQNAKYVFIRANGNYSSQIAFLTSSSHSSNTVPHYCTGTTRNQIARGNDETLQIPEDAKYFYIDRSYSTTQDYTPDGALWQDGEDKVLFWGILGIPKSPKYTTGNEWRIYKSTAGNGNSLLACRVINEAFRNYTVKQIVTTLYNNYIAEEGITLGGISDIDIPIKIYSAADFNLQDALNELSELCNGAWTVTADRKFYFYVYDEFPSFPLAITKTGFPIADFQHVTKAYKQRTIQYISGATNTTIPQTETFVYSADGGGTFGLSFGVNERPSITINGIEVPAARIGVAGLDYNDPSIWFTFAYNSHSVTYNSASNALSNGDEVAITYIGIYSIRISAENQGKIHQLADMTGTSGKREIVTSLSGVRSQDDAIAAANSLLAKFEEADEEVTFWITSEDLYDNGMTLDNVNVMTKVTIDIPEWGVQGDYIVAERHLTPFWADMTEDAERKFKVRLRLVNRDFMKSYGEVLADLKRNLRTLTVRDDEVVVKAFTVNETLTAGESYVYTWLYPNFPVPAASASELFAMPVFTGAQYPT